MKVLLINSFYHPNVLGGAEISVQHLAEGLRLAGHEVVVVCLGTEASVTDVNGVKVYRVPLFNVYFPFVNRPPWPARLLWNLIDIYNPIMARRVGKILESERPDVVHTNILLGFSCAVWREVSKRDIRLVHTIRDHLLLCPRSQMNKRGSNCIRQCLSCNMFSVVKKLMNVHVDTVVGISEYILNRHLSLGWFRNASRDVVFNSFSAVDAKSQRDVDNVLRFGFIGRITEFKGIELLLRSFLPLGGNIELVVAGSGEDDYVEKMKAIAQGAKVKFLGFVERKEFYGQVDVVIMPTLMQEPLGRAILEAYAYGVPVIASRRGGIPEIIEEGQTGFLFDPDKDGELQRCLEQVVRGSWQRDRMSVACVRKSQEFREDVIAGKYIDVYEAMDSPSCRPSHLTSFGNGAQIRRDI